MVNMSARPMKIFDINGVVKKTLIFAHRGASGDYPENTMLAFEKAVEQYADGIEIDVHLSSDGEPVVIHDETLDRTTDGTGDVSGMRYSELRKLDAGINSDYRQRIPHLREVLELVREKGIALNIEIKNDTKNYPQIEEKVIRLVHEYSLEDSVLLSSFNHKSMADCKQIDSYIRTGLLYAAPIFSIFWAERYAVLCGADALHPNYRLLALDKDLLKHCHNANIALNVWTVNEEKDMRPLIAMGVDSIITNYPGKLHDVFMGISA